METNERGNGRHTLATIRITGSRRGAARRIRHRSGGARGYFGRRSVPRQHLYGCGPVATLRGGRR